MKTGRKLLYFATVLWLSAGTGVNSEEEPPDFIITTELREPVTESPSDNGMVLGEVPEEVKTNSPVGVRESKEEEPAAVEPQPVLIAFPQNHKNFTPSQYLGDQDFPPYYNHINHYQQQYKNYNDQKQLFNRKPIKFEDSSVKNYYLPQGVDPLPLEGEEKRVEDHRVTRKPFPYAFENDTVNWYGNTAGGHPLIHEEQSHEYVLRGHQENALPHYILPYGYPYEQKYYEHEVIHPEYHDYHEHHHDVKKTEKIGNPWKKVFSLLTALVPLGLFLATLTPNVISINSTATTKTSRQRSEESSSERFREDILELLAKYGVESLNEAECEDKVICELARKGDKSTANTIEKGFWYLAHETPWDVAEKAGMNQLFNAIKTGNCDLYKCHSQNKKESKKGFVKKLIRKRKPEQ